MSSQKKNTKSEEIKFFKIDGDGDVAPAFPNDQPPSQAEAEEPGRIEPIFQVEPEPLLDAPEVPEISSFSEPPAYEPAPIDKSLQDQIDRLQPQVEDIARQAQSEQRENFTEEQSEILKRYLSLKESESRDLKEQHRQYQAFLKKLGTQVESLNRRNREILSELETLKRRDEAQRAELRDLKQTHAEQIAVLKSEYEAKLKASGNYQSEAADLEKRREEWKEKVREDLKRIKLKERELENKYELLKRDTQALLDSKDKHVLELKKKNDALELEMEGLEERLRKGNVVLGSIDSKKRRLIETMKLAISLLEQIDASEVKKD